jgi:hypothetical protein
VFLWLLLAPSSPQSSGHLADMPFTGTKKQKKETRQSRESDELFNDTYRTNFNWIHT